MWIYVPRGSCPSAPELGSSIPASAWRSQLLASSAALSTKHTPPTSWLRAWKMKPWMRRLFGRIFDPSTAERGVALWMASLEDTRASRSVRPGNVVEKQTSGTSGPSSGKTSPGFARPGASLKTSADTSTLDSQRSTETFEGLVTELKQDFSARRKSARATRERDSSSSQWQTPATDAFRCRGGDRKDEMGLDQEARSWSTPTASGEERGPARYKQGGTPLKQQAMKWPTATAQDAGGSGRHSTKSRAMHPGTTLMDAIQLWPTPRTITGGGESAERKKELGREDSGGGDLQAAVEKWPTPNQRDYKGPDLKSRHGGASLPHFVETGERVHSPSSLQVPVSSVSGGELSSTEISTALRRRLNPAFVCWLMGWPWWWTNPGEISSARSAMGLYLFKLRMLLASLLVERGSPR